MPDYSVKIYISQSEFWRMNREDEPYIGFVEGLGYAFMENLTIGSRKSLDGDIWYNTVAVQRIDYSPEARVRSLNITAEHIIKAIVSRNSDGTYLVNMGSKAATQYLTLSSLDDLFIDIKDMDETSTLFVKATSYTNDKIITVEYSTPLRDFSEQYKNPNSEIIQAIDNANSIIGAPIGWLESKWEVESNANRIFKRNLSTDISKSLRNNGYNVKASTINTKIMPKLLRGLSFGGNFIGGAAIGRNLYINGKMKASDIFLIATFGASCIPGVGWAIGGVFFTADVISLLTTGKSIGDHIDNASNEWSWDFGERSPDVKELDFYISREANLDLDLREMVMPQDNTRVYLPPNYKYGLP